jgi:hypothetical protein
MKAKAKKRNQAAKQKRRSSMPGGSSLTVAQKIAETEATLKHLEGLLFAAMKEIRESDGEEVVLVADSHGKVREKRRPAKVLARQRGITASIRSLEEHLAALREEEAVVKKNRSLNEDVAELDSLLGLAGHVQGN